LNMQHEYFKHFIWRYEKILCHCTIIFLLHQRSNLLIFDTRKHSIAILSTS